MTDKIVWTKAFGGYPPSNTTHILDLDNVMFTCGAALVGGIAANFGIDAILTNTVGVHLLPDISLWEHVKFWIQAPLAGEDWTRYQGWIRSMSSFEYAGFIARLSGVIGLPMFAIYKAFKMTFKESSVERHTGGRRLYEWAEATQELLKRTTQENKKGTPGLKFHPKFQLTEKRESGNLLYIGTAGGGKTVAMKPLIYGALIRGDKCFIYDNKGEWTEEIQNRYVDEEDPKTGEIKRVKKGNPGGVDKMVLIAPWDKRSHAWDIAADCLNKQDAMELASRFIPDSKDPMWSAAAQQIFTAMLLELMHTKGKDWSWADLASMIILTNEEVKQVVKRRMPEAMDSVEDAESKTTQSIMITMKSFMSNIIMLAEAWKPMIKDGKSIPRRKVSFREFVINDDYRHRTIVVQGNGRYERMAKTLMQSILKTMSATMNSAGCPDSKTRKIWLFLDEFPQLGKVDSFMSFLEVGRSKGFRTVIGAQDYNQFTTIYSQTEADTLLSQFKTWVVVKFPLGPTAEWISTSIGTRRFQKRVYSGTMGQAALNFSEVDGEKPVILPSEIESKLGSTDTGKWTGVQALVLGYEDAFIINFPFSNWVKTQPAGIEADWTSIIKDDAPLKVDIPLVSSAPVVASDIELPDEKRQRILAKMAMMNREKEDQMNKRQMMLEMHKNKPPKPASAGGGQSMGSILVNGQSEISEAEFNKNTIKSLDEMNEESSVGEIAKEVAVDSAAHLAAALIPGGDIAVHAIEIAGEVLAGQPQKPMETIQRVQISAEKTDSKTVFKPKRGANEAANEEEDENDF